MKHCLLLLASIYCYTLQAQVVQHSGWLASFNTFKITDKFSAHFDAQVRSSDDLEHLQTILLRPGLNYHVNNKLVLTGGYAYIPNRRVVSSVTGYVPEHRIWQQALYSYKWNKTAISHRLRFEERFLPVAVASNNDLKAEEFRHAYRLRYFIRNVIPITKQPAFTKGVFFALQNEIFLNTGNKSNVNGKTFDQNRLYGAFGYRLPGKLDLEAGYMNQYTKTRTSFVNNHILQLAVYKRL